MFRCDQSGFACGGQTAGAVGGCTKPLGPFGGSRVDSELLGPVGSVVEGSGTLMSLVAPKARGSSFIFAFAEGCDSLDIIVSGTDSAFTGVRTRLSLRLRLWGRGDLEEQGDLFFTAETVSPWLSFSGVIDRSKDLG